MKVFTEKRVLGAIPRAHSWAGLLVGMLAVSIIADDGHCLTVPVRPPHFSHARGFYDQPFVLTLATDDSQAVIRYTLDGSEPTAEHGFVYGDGIPILKTTCLRAAAFRAGCDPSPIVTSTFLLNASGAIKSLPVLSLVGDETESFYMPNGVCAIQGGGYTDNYVSWRPVAAGDYNFALEHGRDFERPVSAELLLPDDFLGFQADCGIRVNGSTYTRSRYRTNSKFSFRLYFRSDYGLRRLDYPLIAGVPVPGFDRIVLRAGQSDGVNPFIKDELARRLQRDMSDVACLGTFVNLFINGRYRGYYNPVERIDEKMFQSRYGSNESWDVVTQWRPEDDDYDWQAGDPVGRTYRLEDRDGDPNAMNGLLDYVIGHDLRVAEHCREVADRLDIVQFADYLILEGYLGHRDWPHNNWTAAREKSKGDLGKWRFYAWDLEHCFYDSDVNSSFKTPSSGGNIQPVGILYEQLAVNEEFRECFADRVQKHFFNGGALQSSNVIARFEELRDTMSGVLPNMNTSIRDAWAPQRPAAVLTSLKSKGLFAFEGPRLQINGAYYDNRAVRKGDILTLENSHGSGVLLYTLDGTDPRISTLELIASEPKTPDPEHEEVAEAERGTVTYEYWMGIPGSSVADLTSHPHFPQEPTDTESLSRFESPVRWADDYGARIYGHLYPPTTGDYTFWIASDNDGELYLSSDADPANRTQIAHVSGWTSPQEWDKYPSQTSASIRLEVGKRYAIEALYKEATGGDHVAVAWQGPGFLRQIIDGQYLSPADDAWTSPPVPDSTGETISPLAFEYAGESIPLGERTVVKARILDGEIWSGLTEGIFTTGRFLWINEVMSANTTILVDPNDLDERPDWIELFNPTDTLIDLGGLYVTDDLQTQMKFRLSPGLTIEPHGFLVLCADGDPARGPTHLSFKLDRQGEAVGIYDGRALQWIDFVQVPSLESNQSFGRRPDGGDVWTVASYPSPGESNAD